MKNHFENVIYQPGATTCQTGTFLDSQGVERCAYTNDREGPGSPAYTPAEYLLKLNAARAQGSPEYVCIPYEEAAPQIEAASESEWCSPWQEITAERWDEMLGVLPPEKWESVRGVEIFRMCEYTCGNITSHFARLGARYFECCCRTSRKYEELAAQVAALVQPKTAAS